MAATETPSTGASPSPPPPSEPRLAAVGALATRARTRLWPALLAVLVKLGLASAPARRRGAAGRATPARDSVRPLTRNAGPAAARGGAPASFGTGASGLVRGVASAIDATERAAVPAVLAAGRAVMAGVDRAERTAVPAVQRVLGTTVVPAFVETFTAPSSTGASPRRDSTRPLAFAAVAVRGLTTGRNGVGGEHRDSDAFDSDRMAAPGPDQRPTSTTVEDRSDLGALVRSRLASAALSLVGLAGTAAVIVIVVSLVAGATVGTAVKEGSGAVEFGLALPSEAALGDLEARTIVFDGSGGQLAVLDREVNRQEVPLALVPEMVRNAVIAAEDRRFYDHEGYDVEGIGRALVANLEAGAITQGGSTITQQLAKSLVGSERSLERKISEVTYAIKLEQEFTKDELLERYLNQVYFGDLAYGIAAASEEFFRVTQAELSPVQAATLAGMIRSPEGSNPRRNPRVAIQRRNGVLRAMVEEGYLPAADLPALLAAPLEVAPPGRREVALPFVVDSIQREFLGDPALAQFGDTPAERYETLYSGGLQIYSTLDPRLQQIATEVLQANFPADPNRPTAAIASVEPISGRVLAAQGALPFEAEQYDLPTQARRQPGSTFKPFVYATALQLGFPASTQLPGGSPAFFDSAPGTGWERNPAGGRSGEQGGVNNYGNASYGALDFRGALTRSVNTAAAQLMLLVTPASVATVVDAMGIDVPAVTGGEPLNPGAVLGGVRNGITPLEMASAYGTFANDGIHVDAHFIDRITDREGNELYNSRQAEGRAVRVLDSDVNAQMVDMMRAVVTSGTGTAAAISGWEVAGKTGTTQGNADAWFVGYTPTMATSLWMGFKDQNDRSTGQTGGGKPADVWQEFMSRALQGQQPVPYPRGDGQTIVAQPGQATTVPDLAGRTTAEAQQLLTGAQLGLALSSSPSAAPVGTVIGQSPRAGSAADSGDVVTVTVSAGVVQAPSPSPRPRDRSRSSGSTSGRPRASEAPSGGTSSDDADEDEDEDEEAASGESSSGDGDSSSSGDDSSSGESSSGDSSSGGGESSSGDDSSGESSSGGAAPEDGLPVPGGD